MALQRASLPMGLGLGQRMKILLVDSCPLKETVLEEPVEALVEGLVEGLEEGVEEEPEEEQQRVVQQVVQQPVVARSLADYCHLLASEFGHPPRAVSTLHFQVSIHN